MNEATRNRHGFIGALASYATMERRALSYIETLPEPSRPVTLITERELENLPPVVQRYFKFSGVLGKPRIDSFGIVMEGRIRQTKDSKWMSMVSRQYNSLSHRARVYFVCGKGTPMSGVDSYVNGKGRMEIKLFNLVSIADVSGPEMDKSALVTFLNDLVFCPTAYFSLPVEWKQIDTNHASISLSNESITVKATITFGSDGRIVNWESDDRFADVNGQQRRDIWSTPVERYEKIEGLCVPASAHAVHNFDGNAYTYVELDKIRNLVCNIDTLPDE